MEKNDSACLLTASKDSPRVKVGTIKKYIPVKNAKTGKTINTPVFYSYKDVETDMDGWVESKKYLPDDFDIVYMRLKRERTIPGWVNGKQWYGYRLKADDEVVFWKRKLEDNDS